MTERNDLSRYQRRNKRRNNNIQIFMFAGLAAVVFIVFLLFVTSDDKEKDKLANEQATENTEENVEIAEEADEKPDKAENEKNEDKEKNEEKNEEDEKVTKQATYADRETYGEEVSLQRLTTTDQNVVEAYIADWSAIGTKQTGKHTVTYDDGSDDREEIKKAISYITDLDEDNIIEHWIGNGGEGKVIATISDKEMKSHYKVYLSWVKDEGWKPTKLEYLEAVKTEKDEPNENKAVEVDAEDKTNNEG